jgi:hypothetical protein
MPAASRRSASPCRRLPRRSASPCRPGCPQGTRIKGRRTQGRRAPARRAAESSATRPSREPPFGLGHPPGLAHPARQKRPLRSSRNTEFPGSTTCSRRLPPVRGAAGSSATRQSRAPPDGLGYTPRLCLSGRPHATPAIVAERRHPGIDDLQSSSSAGPRGGGVECNSTIPGTAPRAPKPSVGIPVPATPRRSAS